MKTTMVLLNKKNAVRAFFKIKIPLLSYLIVIAFLLVITSAHAMPKTAESKISVLSGKNRALSVFTVGSGGNYTTLKAAFDAINAGTITGIITLQIISSTTETATAALNASGSGLANYSSVLIYATGSGYSISCNINSPLVNFNGADNVMIDGRVNALGTAADLTFTNSNTGINACAFKLVNSAENNTIKYANLAASGLSLATAVVNFSTCASGNGNDSNIIEYCSLTNAGGNRPYNGILSSGTAGRENSGNSIRNNDVFNITNTTNNSFGVNISIFSTDWNISANSFYETVSMAPAGAYNYGAIRIATPNMHTISGNFIGGSQPLCGGAPWTMNSSFPIYFSGIFITGNTTVQTLVQNNTIQNFNYTSTNANPWDGIYLSSGNISILGNTIGAATGINSIVVNAPNAAATAVISGGVVTAVNLIGGGSGFTVAPSVTFSLSGSTVPATVNAVITGGVVTGFTIIDGGSGYTSIPTVNISGGMYSTTHGMRLLNSGSVNIENNTIGSITTFGNTAYSHCFEGMVISGPTTSIVTVNNNLIGSLNRANSIKTSSAAGSSIVKQDVRGIYINSAVNIATVTGNTIANLSNAYTGSSTSKVDGICSGANSNSIRNNTIKNLTASINSVTVRGIQQIVTAAGGSQSITGNSIYNLSNTHATAAVVVIGIEYSGPTSGANTVSGNFVHSLTIASANILSEIDGIVVGNGVTTVANNIINIGTSVATGYKIYGINDNSTASAVNNNNLYFNSVYLGGTVSSGVTSSTAALWSTSNTCIRNYRNNILMNIRTGGTSGKHYAVKVGGNSGLTIDYNNYYTSGGTFLGSFSNSDKTTLALWKTATGQDVNSLNTNPVFAIAGGTNPLDYYTSAILPAIPGTGITVDYTTLARSAAPKMGALEITGYVWSGATSTNFAIASNWQNGTVPPDGSDISFAISPSNNCNLDQNRSLRNITNGQSTYKFVLNGYQLNLLGNLIFSNDAKIDATAPSSVLEFGGTVAQNIPSGALVSNILKGCKLNNVAGLSINDDITITQSLGLTTGALTVGAHTLTLNGAVTVLDGTLIGGATSNIIIGGSGAASVPAVALNNLTVNRNTGVGLVGSVSVAGTLVLNDGAISVGANTLTISGNSPTRITGTIDASDVSANVTFSNTAAIILPASIFTAAVNNLTVNGIGGITAAGDFTVNGELNLQSNNPSATKGLLDMWDGSVVKTVTMGANAINTGTGDTTGIIKRTSFTAGVSYTLGSPFMKVYFNNTGTLPSQLSLKLSIGTTPAWRTGAINREIEVIQTGAVSTSGVVSFHYLDSELNGNDEEHLVLWVKIGNIEYGSSAYNTTDNWVSLSNVNVAFFSAAFDGAKNVTLDEYSTANTITWNGSLSTSWTSIENWTPNVGPSGTKNIIIPDASTTPFDPILPSITNIKSLTLDAGGILNSVASAQATIEGTNAWNNYGGTFNANTSNILFNNASATMSGTTNFYDLTINSGKTLSMTEGCNLRIAGGITNNGIWNTLASGSAFVEYNGAAQTIINPNGATAGYSNLILSGSGNKTMVSALQSIYGNLSLVGTVTTTPTANLSIGKSLIIGDATTFNTGNFNHTIQGDFDNSGIFNSAVGHSITLNGTTLQMLLGTSTTTFDELIINNSEGAHTHSNLNITNTLALINGILQTKEANLGIFGTITKTSGFIETSPLSSLTIGGSGAIALQNDLFTTAPTINNLTVNRSGGVTLGQEMTVNGVLNLLSGTLDINDHNLTVGGSGSISVIAPNAAKMIAASGMGQLGKIMVSGNSFTYPIGDNTGTAEYTPITIMLADDGAQDNYYGIKVTNAKHPDNASTSNYLNRYWSLSRSGNIPHLAAVSAAYTSADIAGTEANITGADLVGNFNQSSNPWVKQNALAANLLSIDSIVLTSDQTTVFTGISAANPTVSILGTGDSCSGSNVPLSTLVTGDSNFVYSWSPSDFLSSTAIANPIAVNITATTLYTVIVKDGNGISATASGTVTIGAATTWTGSWSNGVPSSTTSVIISANYTPSASFECCSLTVNNNAVVLIPAGINVTLNGILTVVSGSSFTLQSNANLIQTNDVANSGNITVLRNSAPIKRLDHTLWSSPVTSTETLQQFSPNTLSNRFYVYNILNNTYSATPAIGYFPLAKAIAVRAPNNWSTTESAWGGSFTGIPNNGTITTPLEMTGAAYNGIGNPYPSTISGTDLVNANSTMITGTLYFYAHTLAMDASTVLFPPGTNYAVWNPGTGGTPATVGGGGTGSSPITPNGIIQTGQGFLVKAVAQGNMIFTNSMRKTNTANPFFKQSALKSNTAEPDIERHRIWLSLGTNVALNTILVGYAAGATSGIDYGYDGLKFGNSGSEFYSVISGDAYSIQGRALPFVADDNVPLGFKAAESGNFSIAIYKTDGLFTGDQDILIKDNLTGTTNSIKTAPYNFTSAIGTFDGRFEMVYIKSSLGIDSQTALENSVIVFIKNNTLFVQSSSVIAAVRIFDILGRLLSENKNINDTRFQRDKSSLTRQVVLVEVTDNENKKVVKKIIL
jgi:hypothetical protein